ncbi:MAG: hypothetical protein HUJ63_06030 [Enterococcus sp.]|nr:hypothetical protein [Enterococcus sp.]
MNPDTISEETTFEDLNIDSIDMIELVCELEDRIGKDLTNTPKDLKNIGDFIKYVENL